MGRSVSYPTGAIVAFQQAEYEHSYELSDDIEYFQERISQLFPSMSSCDKWLGREDHAIAENSFAYFGMSEYGGLLALWLVEKPWDGYDTPGFLAAHWLKRVAPRFTKTFGALEKVATMSNGEGVYRKIEA